MKFAYLIFVALLLTACASKPVKSETYTVSDTYSIPYETAWQNAISVLAEQGFAIDSSNFNDGIISTQGSPVKLNERQADCGNFYGMLFLKDYRTTTYMTLSLDFEKMSDTETAIRVKSLLKGTFSAGVGAEQRNLTCFTSGAFERKLLKQIGN